jgi:hypothetical protein
MSSANIATEKKLPKTVPVMEYWMPKHDQDPNNYAMMMKSQLKKCPDNYIKMYICIHTDTEQFAYDKGIITLEEAEFVIDHIKELECRIKWMKKKVDEHNKNEKNK